MFIIKGNTYNIVNFTVIALSKAYDLLDEIS